MEKCCSDIVQVTEQGEQTSFLFVVPNLRVRFSDHVRHTVRVGVKGNGQHTILIKQPPD